MMLERALSSRRANPHGEGNGDESKTKKQQHILFRVTNRASTYLPRTVGLGGQYLSCAAIALLLLLAFSFVFTSRGFVCISPSSFYPSLAPDSSASTASTPILLNERFGVCRFGIRFGIRVHLSSYGIRVPDLCNRVLNLRAWETGFPIFVPVCLLWDPGLPVFFNGLDQFFFKSVWAFKNGPVQFMEWFQYTSKFAQPYIEWSKSL